MVSAGTMLFSSVQSVCVEIVQRRPDLIQTTILATWKFFANLEGVNCIEKPSFCDGIYRYSPDMEYFLASSFSWTGMNDFYSNSERMARIWGDGFCRCSADTGSLLMFAQCGTQAAKSATKFRKVAGTWWLYFVQKQVLVARFCCFEASEGSVWIFGAKVMFESLIKQDIAFFDGTMTGLSTAFMTIASHWCLQWFPKMFLCFGKFICKGVRCLELWIPKGRLFGSFGWKFDRQGQLTSRMTNDVAAVVQPVRQIMRLAAVGASAITPSKAPDEIMLKMTFHHMLVACNQYCFHRVDASKFLLCQEHFLDQHSTPDWGSLHVPLYIMETHCAMSESWWFFVIFSLGVWQRISLREIHLGCRSSDFTLWNTESHQMSVCFVEVLAATMIGPVVYLTGVYAKWSKQLGWEVYKVKSKRWRIRWKGPLSHHTPPKMNQKLPN